MKFKIKNYLFVAFVFCFGFGLASSVQAQDLSGVQYPVAELGNCFDQETCEAYCDLAENMNACINFAEAEGIFTSLEAERSRVFADLGVRTGPGGCDLINSCEAYCDNFDNLDECLAFAEQYNLLSDKELESARQLTLALQNLSEFPGGCHSQSVCENYCLDFNNLDECLDFALVTGLITEAEANAFRTAGNVGPGGCQTLGACNAFCAEQINWEECLTFARTYNIPVP